MIDEAEPVSVAIQVVAELDRLNIDYLVGGSIASSVHGRPRTTEDADLVAKVEDRHVEHLVRDLEGEFYVEADMIRDAIRDRASFNLIHLESMLKVDIFVFRGDAFSADEMRRRIAIPLRGQKVWFASPEDIVLQKLDWYRQGGGVSERQWRDVVGVLQVQGERFDLTYARSWAARLALADLLERAVVESTRP